MCRSRLEDGYGRYVPVPVFDCCRNRSYFSHRQCRFRDVLEYLGLIGLVAAFLKVGSFQSFSPFRSNLFYSLATGFLSLFEKDGLEMTIDEHFSVLFGID